MKSKLHYTKVSRTKNFLGKTTLYFYRFDFLSFSQVLQDSYCGMECRFFQVDIEIGTMPL